MPAELQERTSKLHGLSCTHCPLKCHNCLRMYGLYISMADAQRFQSQHQMVHLQPRSSLGSTGKCTLQWFEVSQSAVSIENEGGAEVERRGTPRRESPVGGRDPVSLWTRTRSALATLLWVFESIGTSWRSSITSLPLLLPETVSTFAVTSVKKGRMCSWWDCFNVSGWGYFICFHFCQAA